MFQYYVKHLDYHLFFENKLNHCFYIVILIIQYNIFIMEVKQFLHLAENNSFLFEKGVNRF